MSRYVYVAGPYTGDEEGNVARALVAATALLKARLYPYVPHLSHYWEAQHQHHYEVWMELDFGWVRRCDAVLRLPGPSSGADREVELAERLGLPVFRSTDEVLAWASAPAPVEGPTNPKDPVWIAWRALVDYGEHTGEAEALENASEIREGLLDRTVALWLALLGTEAAPVESAPGARVRYEYDPACPLCPEGPASAPASPPAAEPPTPPDDVACYCGAKRLPMSERAEITSITGRDGVEHRKDRCIGPTAEPGTCPVHKEHTAQRVDRPCRKCGTGPVFFHDGMGSTTTDEHWWCLQCGAEGYVDGIDS